MLHLISNSLKSYNSTGLSMLRDLEEENSKNESFFKEIENWRNIEVNYIAKISQVVSNLRDRSYKPPNRQASKDTEHQTEKQEESQLYFCANAELAKILQIVIDNHKSFISKINYDIFLVNCDSAEKLLSESKKILQEEKQQQKEINSKRDALEKVLGKRDKLKKQKQQEEMLQIFLLDSVETTMDQKIRKKNKIKEIEKEAEEFELKVKETIEDYRKMYERNKESINRIKHNYKQQNRCKVETLLKVQLHLNTYWKNLISHIDEYSSQTKYKGIEELNQCIFTRMNKKEDYMSKKLNCKVGFVENSLKLINENIIEELLQYSRDKEVKTKIKRMMQTNDVNPEETDEVSRQVKLIKKMLLQEQVEKQCIQIFKSIVGKNSKLRMNFVFILQFFRINNQFEISLGQIHSLHCLISQFLQSCYNSRDSFVLKQLMILLMTYYVSHTKQNSEVEKIYIIHFFKKNLLWKEIEYWQSILLECIYLEKRNTMKMMIVSESGNMGRKKELLQAERLAILNQMLMVVRNMVIFQFNEKEVKHFAQRFIKLLRQDQKFQKDVFNTIEDAIKEQTQLLQQQRQSIKDYYLENLVKSKSEEYTIPESVRKSYTG